MGLWANNIYTKHQYRQELEYGSTVILYIPTILNKYTIIIERDLILQEYYITKRFKIMIYKEIYKVLRADKCSLTVTGNLESRSRGG